MAITCVGSLLFLQSFALCRLGDAQSVTVLVTDPRPIADAAIRLEQVYGVPINYEDPITVNESRMENRSDHVQGTSVSPRQTMVHKTESLSFTYRVPKSLPSWGGDPQQFKAESIRAVADALTSVLAGYAASGAPENFSIREEDEMLFIVPKDFLNKEGKLAVTSPIMDTKLTISPRSRTRGDFLEEFCKSLSDAANARVTCMFQLDPRILQKQTTASGSGVTAHSLLDQLLVELNAPKTKGIAYIFGPNGERVPKEAVFNRSLGAFSWQLRFVIGGGYVLSGGYTSVAND
jgi:hypothetical protein